MTVARVHSKLGEGQHVEGSGELAFSYFPHIPFLWRSPWHHNPDVFPHILQFAVLPPVLFLFFSFLFSFFSLATGTTTCMSKFVCISTLMNDLHVETK